MPLNIDSFMHIYSMLKRLVVFILLLLGVITSNAQSVQNCMGAIPVCQMTYSQTNAYSGVGNLNELNASNQGCLTTGENNSVWYIINTSTAGTLQFSITPNVGTDDYDFAVWDLTDKPCAAISSGGLTPLRCNYASLANSSPNGLTGLSSAGALPSYGAAGPSFSSVINTTPGQTYVICINNASSSAAGYLLNFAGSTTNIVDNTPPTIKADTIALSCNNPTSIKILLSENVKCTSIASNGSDFSLTPASASVINVASSSCAAGGDFTNLLNLTFSNPIPPGTYTLSVQNGTDGNTLIDNCNNPMAMGQNITFTVQPPVHINANAVFGCAGTPSGLITVSGNGGTLPYTYKLNAGAFTTNTTFSGLTAGTYTLTIKDSIGCVDDTIISLIPSAPIAIQSATVTNVTCFGANNGSVTILANGGNPPLSYAVNVAPYNASNTITGLGPGSFIVHVKDANGCIKDTVIFVSSPGQINIGSLLLTNATCGASNGSIVATAFGGTPALSYALNLGAYQGNGTFNNLAAGTYTLHIKDANNCIKDSILIISQLSSVAIASVQLVQPTCSGGSGSITINETGGTAPYTYSNNNGGNYTTSSVFTNLGSGTYTIVVKDANGCTASSIATLTLPVNLYFGNTTVILPTCTTLGSITTSGLGGTSPYTFAIGANTYSSANTFNNLAAGTYIIHVQDVNGCIHDSTINLIATQVPVINSNITINPTCSNPSSGNITVNSSGGIAPITYNINGGAFGTTNNFTGLGAGTYTVIVKDANNCTISSIVILTQVNTVNFATISATNIGCFGTPLGTITSTGTGGNAPYTYSLNGAPFVASGNFSNLAAGNYTVVVKDASGCTYSYALLIKSSAVVQINSLAFTNATCAQPGNGTINVSGTVSFAPISYFVSSVGTNNTGVFTGLAAGTYTVSVYDGAGCHKDSVITITAPPPLFFTNVVIVMAPCFGGIGSISLQGIGGLPPYQYAFTTGPYGSTNSWLNIVAGSYVIHLQDANGCIRDTTIDLIEPPQINITSVVLVNASCNLAATGSITLTATGGSPGFTYSLNGGPFGATNSFLNLASGNYVITVKDANGCTVQTSASINNNGNYFITSIITTQPNCYNGSNGTATINVTGGLAPYQYSINTGPFSTTNLFTGLTAGTYTLHSIDNSGCSKDSIIFIGQPVQVGISNIIKTMPLCFGASNGNIVITGNGGTAPYTYALNTGLYTPLSTFSNLTTGTYTLHVKDANGCIKDTIVSLGTPNQVGISNVSILQPGCFNNTGIITFSGFSGTPPYTFAVDLGLYVSTNSFGGLLPGLHVIHVKDANGCIKDSAITLTLSPTVSITSLTYSPIVCLLSATGTISVVGASAFAPLTYQLNGGGQFNSGNFSNLAAGIYTLQVEDFQGCFIDTIITIQNAPAIIINSAGFTNPLCASTNSGTINITSSGGFGPISYAINTGAYSTSSVFSNLFSGTYIVHSKDSLGCIKDTIIVLTAPPPISITSIAIQNPFCSSATDGVININATGGVPTYTYALNASIYTSNNIFTNLISGIYTVHIKDANNCIKDTIVNLIAASYMSFANVIITNVSCKFGNDGAISTNAINGNAPYQYTINTVSTGTNSLFQNLGTGAYTIGVTDNLGCVHDTIINVSEPANPALALILGTTGNKCRGDSNGVIIAGATGGTPPYQYSINGGLNYQAGNTFNNLLGGNYIITIKDNKGCIDDTLATVIDPDTSVQIVLINIKQISCIDVADAAITVNARYGFLPYQFYFNGTNVGIDTLYENLGPGNYVIEVVDSIGCKSTGKYSISPSTKKPYIVVDDIKNVLCPGDTTGHVVWHTENGFIPYKYTFNGTNIGYQNSQYNLNDNTYYIQSIDTIGCYADTTIRVYADDDLKVEVTPREASCAGLGDDGSATAINIQGYPPFTYFWSGNSSTNLDNVYPLNYGLQSIIIQDSLGCRDTTEFVVPYNPCCEVNIPNAFTPNGDNNNDDFKAVLYGYITLVDFQIFDRWGNMVFQTKDPKKGWDGNYKGTKSDLGTYFYFYKYKCRLKQEIEMFKGDVILIR
jgi:gliding motility-associated-like protein